MARRAEPRHLSAGARSEPPQIPGVDLDNFDRDRLASRSPAAPRRGKGIGDLDQDRRGPRELGV